MKKLLLLLLFTLSISIHGSNIASLNVYSDYKSVRETTTFNLAFEFNLPPEWHIYWINPGDSGYSPTFKQVEGPVLDFSLLRWPYPESFSLDTFQNYGYSNKATLILPVPPNNTITQIKKVYRSG